MVIIMMEVSADHATKIVKNVKIVNIVNYVQKIIISFLTKKLAVYVQ